MAQNGAILLVCQKFITVMVIIKFIIDYERLGIFMTVDNVLFNNGM